MKSTTKRAILTKLLEGRPNSLKAIEADNNRICVFIVDRMSAGNSEIPAFTRYTLSDGVSRTGMLTESQRNELAQSDAANVVLTLPDSGRLPWE